MRVAKIMPPIIIFLLAMTGCHSHDRSAENTDPEPGVSLALATERAQSIAGVSYDLSFTIPAVPSQPISGKATIRFAARDVTHPLVLDFSPGRDHITSISVGGRPSHFRLVKDHIIVPN